MTDPKSKALFLTPRRVHSYSGAFYQRDIIRIFSQKFELFFLGPGYPSFDPNDTWSEVLAKLPFNPDIVVLGHMWLSDKPGEAISPNAGLAFRGGSPPVLAFLNKEYARLNEKLEWLEAANVSLAVSHHPQIHSLAPETRLPLVYSPFGVDPERFGVEKSGTTVDVGFTGVLRNPSVPLTQSDVREQVMRDIFVTFRDVPIRKRKIWSTRNVEWRSWSADGPSNLISTLSPLRRRLPAGKYPQLLSSSKTWLNSLSPTGIIGTRYFECMISGTVVLSEYSDELARLFEKDSIIFFSGTGDFREKVFWLTSDEKARSEIACRARELVVSKHLWHHRIGDILEALNRI